MTTAPDRHVSAPQASAPRASAPQAAVADAERPDLSRAVAAVAIALAAFAVYANSLRVPLLFDDIGAIVDNATIRDLGRLGAVLSPPGGTLAVEGRPIVNLTLALNYAVGGTGVYVYHLFNLLVHGAAALTLFGLVRRTLLLPSLAPRWGGGATGTAAAIALLWTVHPLQTETVTYVIQRGESLMALCYLLTLYAVARGATSARPGRWHAAAVVACAVGAGCKEVIVTAPLVVLLYDRIFLAASWREIAQRRRWLYAGLLASWAILGALVASFYEPTGTAGSAALLGPWGYARLQPGNVLRYLKLALWPHPLVLDYGTQRPLAPAAELATWAAVAALLGATAWALRRAPRIGFLGAAFFLVLAPTTSVLPLSFQTAAEKRMYLPLAAVVTLAVLGAQAAGRRLAGRRPGATAAPSRGAATALAAVVALVLGGLAVQRNHVYQSGLAIWQDTVAKQPDNARAQYNLALELIRVNDLPGAIAHSDRAIALNPTRPEFYNNRALARFALGAYPQAWNDAQRCLSLGGQPHPDFLAALRQALGTAQPAPGR